MHRYLIKCDEIIDHINGNRKDNRLCNLRKSNVSLNSHNKKKKENTTSKYIGVRFNKNKYTASITKDGKCYYLGRFENEEDAAKAYNKKSVELYGEFAKLNDIKVQQTNP